MTPNGKPHFAEVAVAGCHPGGDSPTLTYALEPGQTNDARAGRLVWVPLRKSTSLGVIVSIHCRVPEFDVKPVFEIVSDDYELSAEQLGFGQWLYRQTASTLFACLRLWMPPGVEHSFTPWFELRTRPAKTTPMQAKVIERLGLNGTMSLEQLQEAVGSPLTSVLPELERMHAIGRTYRSDVHIRGSRQERWWIACQNATEKERLTTRQAEVLSVVREYGADGVRAAELADRTGVSASVTSRLVELGLIEGFDRPIVPPGDVRIFGSVPQLTDEQARVWQGLTAELESPTGKTQLLFGITGSGKTELYLRAIAATLRLGRSAVVLVPEIALTTHIADRVRERFPGRVAVLHSGMASGLRQRTWSQVESGERSIVLGPRSALFAPVPDLGLIVIDEEHDPAYKQDSDPRYNARTAAVELARRAEATLIVGSATPSLETLWSAEQGETDSWRLTRRAVPGAPDLPPVQIIDIRSELGDGHTSLLSRPLIAAIRTALERKEQSLILLNRRGMATVVLCRSCGHSVTCPNCAIPLVYHQDRAQMICHRCDHRERPLVACPDCGGTLDYFGAGTQRIEAETKRMFANARVVRWDADISRRAGASSRILKSIEERQVDIVVGTQLIAKGLDLPFATTVGIVNADVGLHFPDFRSGERTFQLLTQMAGRAGRRTPNSRVVVQTYSPDHYVLQAAAQHDVEGFYRREIRFRREYRYPPFVRLIRFAVRRATDEDCAVEADALLRQLGRHARDLGVVIDVVGPAPAFVARIRGEAQWHMILKAAPEDLDVLLDGLPHPPGWIVDIDPLSLL